MSGQLTFDFERFAEAQLYIKINEMVGTHDRPQQVLDFIDMVVKLFTGEVWR